ncbi:MAG: acyl carrier protein [Candidatus Omnitrophota bacterium]
MALKEDVINAIADILDVKVSELTESEKLYDSIGVDSTEMVELCVSLGKKFGVKIAANEITKTSTPLEITALIERKKQ